MTFLIKHIKYTLGIYLFFAFGFSVSAQKVTVINGKTQEPIAGVALYNKGKLVTTVTDIDGVTNLDAFSATEDIFIKHLSFELQKIKKSRIVNNTIFLKFEQNRRDIPKTISSVSSKAIQFSNPQTSADLLESTGKVYIQKSQLGGGSPMIRGFSTNRLLITVDGVRMNNAIFRGGNLQNVISVDPFSINNTEVTLGAGSIIYGSDAIGGVMSFYTKKPKFSLTDSTRINANALVRYATASEEKTAHIDFNMGYKKWAFLTNVSYTNFNDLRMGKHGPEDYLRPEFVNTNNGVDEIIENTNPLIQKFTGYNQVNLMQKVSFKPYENLDFDLGLFYTTTSDNPRYDRLIRYRNGQLRSAEWYYGPQKWFMSNLQVTRF